MKQFVVVLLVHIVFIQSLKIYHSFCLNTITNRPKSCSTSQLFFATNKQAGFEYEFEEKYEAGIKVSVFPIVRIFLTFKFVVVRYRGKKLS